MLFRNDKHDIGVVDDFVSGKVDDVIKIVNNWLLSAIDLTESPSKESTHLINSE